MFKLERVIGSTILVAAALSISSIAYKSPLLTKSILLLQSSSLINCTSEKSLIFFLSTIVALLPSILLAPIMFSINSSQKKYKKMFRDAFLKHISLSYLTFSLLITAYVFKIDMTFLAKQMVLIVISISASLFANLIGAEMLDFIFVMTCLFCNFSIFSRIFFRNQSLLGEIVSKFHGLFNF